MDLTTLISELDAQIVKHQENILRQEQARFRMEGGLIALQERRADLVQKLRDQESAEDDTE